MGAVLCSAVVWCWVLVLVLVRVLVRFGERNGKSFGFPFHGGRETSEIER